MSLLTDYDIHRKIQRKELEISPYDQSSLGPASYDVTLDKAFRRFTSETVLGGGLDVANIPVGHTELIEEQRDSEGRLTITLQPHEFVLASTVEVVRLGQALAARVEGRSSLGRLGILVHITAGFLDPGFCGQVTLEICNLAPMPITLRPGMRIAQLAFTNMQRTAHQAYGASGAYQGQVGPTESRFRLESAKRGVLHPFV